MAGNISLEELVALNDEIASLARSGVPLELGLNGFGVSVRGRLGRLAKRLGTSVAQGKSLPQSLDESDANFPPIYRAIVTAGMRTGRLPAALEAVATSARNLQEVRRSIGLALLYPLVLVVAGYFALWLVLAQITPVLLGVYEGSPPPFWASVAEIGQFANRTIPIPGTELGIIVGWIPSLLLMMAIVLMRLSSRGSALLGGGAGRRLAAHLPWVGRVVRNGRMAALAEILGLLVEQDVPLSEALVLSADVAADRQLAARRAAFGNAGAGRQAAERRATSEFSAAVGVAGVVRRTATDVCLFVPPRGRNVSSPRRQPIALAARVAADVAGGCRRRRPSGAIGRDHVSAVCPNDASLWREHGRVNALEAMNEVEHPMPNEADASRSSSRLNRADAVELAHYISALARADLPMAGGARAIAGDLPPGQLAATLRRVAEAVEHGQSLEDALGHSLPPHVRELIVAGADSGRLAETLDALLVHERSMDDLGQQLWQAVSYPCTLFAFLLAWLLFIALWLVPQMDTSLLLADIEESWGYGQYLMTFNSNEPYEPRYAERLIEFARVLPPVVLIVGCCLGVALVATRLFGGRALISRLMTCTPLIGPAWRYRGLTEFAGLSSLFLRQPMPLAEAMRLTATAARDGAVRDVAAFSAEQADAGRPLSQALDQCFGIPATMVNLVAWGESNNALAESLNSARRMTAERFELQLRLIRLVVPPLVFLLAAGSAVFVAYGWIGALTHAIRMLSDWT